MVVSPKPQGQARRKHRKGAQAASPDGRVALRICVGCGTRAPTSELLTLHVDADGAVYPDLRQRCGGRSAHVCFRLSCLEAALKKKRLSRSFGGGPVTSEIHALLELIRQQLVERVGYLLSLSQKAGRFVTGSLLVENALKKPQRVALLVTTSDIAKSTRDRLVHLAAVAGVSHFDLEWNRAELGALIGKEARVGGVILSGPIGDAVRQDLSRLEALKAHVAVIDERA